jgi:hypothetical protein
MRARRLLVIGIAISLQAQDPPDLLQEVRAKVTDTLDRLPRYMCRQTISRSVYEPNPDQGGKACDQPPNTHLTVEDRLRLDVAMTSIGEVYAWAGASKFSDRDLIDLVQDGAISTGSFGNLLSAIFRTDSASFSTHGPHGHNLMEFGFHVPYEKSEYTHGDHEHRAIAGYGGTFLVDTQTGDLVQLMVRTEALPPETGSCYSTTSLSYARVRLRDDAFLLPTESRLTIFSRDGSKFENRTVFSACHQFLGETSVKFDERGASPWVSSGDSPAVSQAKPVVIPPGLPFSVVLMEEIKTATAATGDIVHAKLTTAIEDSTGVLVPAGAIVRARLVRMRQYYNATWGVSIAIQLQTVEVGGALVDLTAVPDTGKSFPKDAKPQPGEITPSVPLGPLSSVENHAVTYNIRFDRPPYHIPVNLKSNWVTANP